MWEENDFEEDAWFIDFVRNDLYNTIGSDFPLSFYFTFLPELH